MGTSLVRKAGYTVIRPKWQFTREPPSHLLGFGDAMSCSWALTPEPFGSLLKSYPRALGSM